MRPTLPYGPDSPKAPAVARAKLRFPACCALLVTRDATLKAKDGHTVKATERCIMLLDTARFPTN